MSHTKGKLTLGKHGVIYGRPFREYARGSAQDQFAMVASAHEDEIEIDGIGDVVNVEIKQ